MVKLTLYKLIIIIVVWLFTCISAFSQVFLNNGGVVDAYPGSFIQVNGSLQNDSGLLSIGEEGGVNSELTVTGDIINNSVTEGEGHIILYGNWINNEIFNCHTGTVFLNGNNQLLSGTSETQFYNLTLDGSGLKTQTINKYVTGILDLNHLELQTETFTMFVENTDANSIQRTTGFVSSLEEGSLSRQTSSVETYLFPVGSSLGVNRYRPVEIDPINATNNTYTVRMANVDATTEGFNRDLAEELICETNPYFYHRINRSSGSSPVNLSIFYDENIDGNYDGIANWTNIPQWNIIQESNTISGTPFSIAGVDNWDTFDETPYILYIENFIIDAGEDIIVCADDPVVELNATFSGSGTVTWSGGNGTFVPNANSLNATYNPSPDEVNAGSATLTITSNLPAGSCGAVSDEVIITFLPAPDVEIVVSNEISCFGINDGSLIVSPAGNYTYEWSNGQATSQISGLGDGIYTVTVTDANGCSTIASHTLTEPSEIQISLTPNSVTCYGDSNGSINTIVSGGTPSYSYLWDDAANSPVPNPVNLPAGTYTLLVTDSNGCTSEASTVINQPDILQITVQTMPVVCGSSLGSALAIPSGGNGGYEYLWSNGDNTAQASNLTSGMYEVVVSDMEGCSVSQSVNISMQGNISVSIIENLPISCYGETDGSLTAVANNGVEPYIYYWSNSETTPTISNLSSGLYSVEISDDWGCIGNASYTLSDPQEINIFFSTTDVACHGESTGSATVNPEGGHESYSFEWSNGMTTQTISNQSAGVYSITVTDAYGCTNSSSVNIEQPDSQLNADIEYTNIMCYGENNGWIVSNAIGGTAPYSYTYEFSNQSINSSDVYNLPQGNYSLTIEDANNCIYQTTIGISEPAPLEVAYFYQGPSCTGNNDGYIELIVNGGTSPYTYSWENGFSPVEYIEGLIEGSYVITVTDHNECTLTVGPINLIENDEDCIVIPNAFTPNGDGINDEWIIENIHIFPSAYIQVFNRWGQQLYEGRGSGEPWDGKYNGQYVPTGSYIYVIQLYLGGKTYHGIVTVVY